MPNKKRVHELAKDLGLNSKDMITKLADIGIEVGSHMSTLEKDDLEKALQTYGRRADGKKPEGRKPEGRKPEGRKPEGR
ncbi:MAG: translation initiation factor IF-2 N-terminal domain-containing protein, partial [Clostridia bacterium]|nr:translation initiation factor IF-2 N-terminal domain-containing protein [Clostridia bacterium]